MIHNLKILPRFYRDVLERRKTFEVRKNDRPFAVGDRVVLQEYDPDVAGGYTGRMWSGKITYILNDIRYCKRNYIIFSIEEL